MSATRIGGRIRKARKARGLTQGELAGMIGCHRVSLARIEGGGRGAALPTLRRLARALRVRTAYLLGDLPEPNAQPATKSAGS